MASSKYFRLLNGRYTADKEFDEALLPTSTQKDALAGEGTPSSSNKFACKDYVDAGNCICFEWKKLGTITASNDPIDGVRIVPFNCTIDSVWASLRLVGQNTTSILLQFNYNSNTVPSPGNTGDFLLDISGNHLYTTSGNRPTIPGYGELEEDTGRILHAYQPDVTALTKGMILTMYIVTAGSNVIDLEACIFARKL